MQRTQFWFGGLLLWFVSAMAPSAAAEPRGLPAADAVLTRIGFGSCAYEGTSQPIWKAVNKSAPELFVFLGDNVYLDTRDPAIMARKYRQLADQRGFRRLRANTALVAIWDDHDFGENDAGAEFPAKSAARDAFLKFWNEPKSSARWTRAGIYTSYVFGPAGQRVQIILPDLRWNRTPLTVNPRFGDLQGYGNWTDQQEGSTAPIPGPYARNPDRQASQLGEAQWAWLEAQLREPADVRIIGSSLQVLADFTGWEAWSNFPRDQQRLIGLIRDTGARNVVFISGDTHYGELTKLDVNVPYPLFDLTSSGLTEVWKVPVPNALREGESFHQANFGRIDIDWPGQTMTLSLRDESGGVLLAKQLPIR
ncbi:phosphodiesterase [Ahniella affigens]|uniref:Phosphodiesterase n=1 Tax=Ahniella affigens TaxID=2021234 RepID=A0A2P1PTW7_9GAMM|nr:alkaline phosphatase D family protein [Ahniella affigens]AVP98286.1 phosphodiesterase [Ahniella affigens]